MVVAHVRNFSMEKIVMRTPTSQIDFTDDDTLTIQEIISRHMDDYNSSNGDDRSRRQIIGKLRNELSEMVGGSFADRTIAHLFFTPNETAEVLPPVEPTSPNVGTDSFVSFKAARRAA